MRVALRWAVDEAARRELEIELIYALAIPVVSDAYGMVMTRPDVDELAEYSEELLGAAEKVARSYDPDLVVSSRLLHGPPAAVLLEASKHAARSVLGTRGVGAINRRALGSVSIRVAAKSACPVYVIPPDYDPAAATGDPVVVGVDGSPHGDAALKVALDDARCRDACCGSSRPTTSPGWPDRSSRADHRVPAVGALAGREDRRPGAGPGAAP